MYSALNPGYVEKCSATLKASLNNGGELPREEHLDNFMRLSSAALNAALVEDQLLDLVANVVMSCNKELTNRLESHVKLGTDASQIYDVPNGAQLQNISICNLIYHHEQNMQQFVQDLKKGESSGSGRGKIFESLLTSLTSGRNLSMAIVQQLVDAINSSVSDILISMHREPALNTSQSTSHPSLYMKELHDFIARVWASHIQPFVDKEMKQNCGKELASRCIELFIRNAAILRPLTAQGRSKLKVDAQFIETALKPIVPNISAIGRLFRTLRAFQSVIVMSVEELAGQNLEPDTPVPAYIVLLLMFSYAGTDLISPHVTAGWTNEKLLKWLDGHTADRDRFELISGALLKYRNDIRKKNLSQYDPVYPVISNCLEKAYQSRKG